mgnify:CR=1 FL=1
MGGCSFYIHSMFFSLVCQVLNPRNEYKNVAVNSSIRIARPRISCYPRVLFKGMEYAYWDYDAPHPDYLILCKICRNEVLLIWI